MTRALILSQTRMFSDVLTKEAITRGFPITLVGTSVKHLQKEPALQGAMFRQADLADPYALPGAMCACWEKITNVFIVASPFKHKRLVDQPVEDMRHIIDTNLAGPIAAITAFHRMRLQSKLLAETPGAPYHLTVILDATSWPSTKSGATHSASQSGLAGFMKTFAAELFTELPGSKVTLFHLIGPQPVEERPRIDYGAAAGHIWDAVLDQQPKFIEYKVARNSGDSLRLEVEARY